MKELVMAKSSVSGLTRLRSSLPEEFWTYITTGLSGLFLLFSWFGLFKEQAGFDMAWVSIMISGIPILHGAAKGLIVHKDIKAGTLVSIALIAAVVIGEYFAAGEVAFIMMIGELLEERTVARAKDGIKELFKVVPPTARIRRDGQEIHISAEEVQVGDIVLVKPGEYIPVDGEVISGQSTVSQAAVTGEGMPVDKVSGDEVYIGSLNQLGALEIKAAKVGEDTTLAKVITLVQEAENSKAPVIRTADRWATWMVPAALLAAVAVYVFTGDVIRAVTILIVFCPCALCLATPTAIMASIGNAAKHGILVKSGQAMEICGKVNAVIFDKTGTLTKGQPAVTEIRALNGFSERQLMTLAAVAEKFSEHPLAKAVLKKAYEENITAPDPDSFQARLGHGLEVSYLGSLILVGNRNMMEQEAIQLTDETEDFIQQAEGKGQTAILLAVDRILAGVVVIADPIKEESAETVKNLKENGIREIWMLTGDNLRTAAAIATKTGITRYMAEQLPGQKGDTVKRLKEQGHYVAMVGDGINDAPALALADVGIAMGVTGTDVALETADIALMSDDMSKIVRLVKLSRHTLRTIHKNIVLSMLINLIAIVLASLGIMGPIVGALVHNAGSVLVIANSGRLLKWKAASSE